MNKLFLIPILCLTSCSLFQKGSSTVKVAEVTKVDPTNVAKTTLEIHDDVRDLGDGVKQLADIAPKYGVEITKLSTNITDNYNKLQDTSHKLQLDVDQLRDAVIVSNTQAAIMSENYTEVSQSLISQSKEIAKLTAQSAKLKLYRNILVGALSLFLLYLFLPKLLKALKPL